MGYVGSVRHPWSRKYPLRAIPTNTRFSTVCSKQPHDTVLAKIAGKLVPVLRVRIPNSLHTHGLLVYLASASQPEEVLVRSPSGKILMSEDLSRAAREGRETCEGESEGAGPPPGGFGDTGETRRIVLSG